MPCAMHFTRRRLFLTRREWSFCAREVPNLLLDRYFTRAIKKAQPKWRLVVALAVKHGVAVPAFSASLAYFDSYRSARLPANLLQAQRDFFGAHTYERIDKPGVF